MSERTVVIHGASGVQGAPVAAAIGRRGWRVVPLGRKEGDLADADSLVAAYQGADAVVIQLPLVFDEETIDRHVQSVLDALRRAAVPRVVFNANAMLPPVTIGIPFVDGRVRLAQGLADAVPAATVVAPRFAYLENLALPTSVQRIVDRRELAYPIPADYPMPWLALDDLAAVVVQLLDAATLPERRTVAGPAALTGPETAAALSAAIGREIRWVSIDHVEYEAMLAPHLGPDAAAGVASFYAQPPEPAGEVPAPDGVVGPTSIDDWAAARSW